jgi:hypothetical protein
MITDLYSLLQTLIGDDNQISEEDAQAAQNVITEAMAAGTLDIT